jgi:branched-chain amino acid transport system substrate-binding protein
MDYAAGHTELEGFKEVFEALGGTVIQEIYTPMNTADYGPYMAMIDVENADFVWAFHWGGDAIRLVTSLDDYGIKDKLSMFFSAAPVEFSWLAPQGDSALGIEDASHYSTALNTTENTIFAQAIWDSYQEPATLYTEHGYVAARMAILALQAVDGDVEDVDSLIEAIENLEFEAPRGPIKFELHTPVQNVYHRVVERVDGELQNTVIDTYPDIGPYWLPEELR